MGLDNREGGNYITILNGKFCQRVDKSVVGAVERVNKLGKVVYEKFYDSFTGKLVNIKTQDGTYGKSWVFDFKDKDEVYHLQLSYSNSFATAFLKMLPNIDLSKEIKVSPSVKEVDGKNKSSLFINQNGQTIKHAYTKDAPNGLPPMTQVMVKGSPVWDDTDRIEFLHAMVMKDIVPKLEGTPAGQASAPMAKKEDSFEKEVDEINKSAGADEDVPF